MVMRKKEADKEKKEEKELDSYLKEHVKDYIGFQLKQGYEYKDIKACLNKYGYSDRQIDNLSKGMDKTHHVAEKKYNKEDLDKESYYYIRGIIADYIKKQLEHGYSLEHIKKALINAGHDKSLIEHAINLIKEKVKTHFPSKATLIISLLIVLAFIFSLGVSLNHASSVMILAFFPVIITLIINYALMSSKYTYKIKNSLPIVAIVLVIALFLALVPRLGAELDYGTILILNVILAVLLTIFMLLFSKK